MTRRRSWIALATIARRTIQLGDPFEDMGGMLIRHLVWRVFEREGDGGATAAVLTQSIVREGVRYIAAGGNPVLMRRGIERGLDVAVDALRRQAHLIDGPTEIADVVAGSLRNAELADMIGEVVDAAGPDGSIQVEDAQGTDTSLEYIDGVRWNEGYVSAFLLQKDEVETTRVLNPRVLVTDHSLDRAEDLLPTLEACVAAGERNLLIVAPEIRDSAVGLLVVNRERGLLDGAIAVRAPSFGPQRSRILEDLAVITGGRCLSPGPPGPPRGRHDRRSGDGSAGVGDQGRVRHPGRPGKQGAHSRADCRSQSGARHGRRRRVHYPRRSRNESANWPARRRSFAWGRRARVSKRSSSCGSKRR